MLSILIPTYNYNIFHSVAELNRQCVLEQIDFEILAIDDASGGFFKENNGINALDHCRYEVLEKNIGRSKIRNLLAEKARFDWLLFLDADTMPINDAFISNYLAEFKKGESAINGGIRYSSEKPQKEKILRWTYGKDREALTAAKRGENPYLAFLSLNFAIPKSLFAKVRFDESLPNLRHEDTVFSYQLKTNAIPVKHIENPVFHLGLDDFENMLRKEHEALLALKQLLSEAKISADYVKMGRYYDFLRRTHLDFFVKSFFKLTRKSLLQDISKPRPSLFLYDIYRLGYLCSL